MNKWRKSLFIDYRREGIAVMRLKYEIINSSQPPWVKVDLIKSMANHYSHFEHVRYIVQTNRRETMYRKKWNRK